MRGNNKIYIRITLVTISLRKICKTPHYGHVLLGRSRDKFHDFYFGFVTSMQFQ